MNRYIVVGDNNFWYGDFYAAGDAELTMALESIRARIANGDYPESSDLDHPNELIAFKLVDVLQRRMSLNV